MQLQLEGAKLPLHERLKLASELLGDVSAGGFEGYFRGVELPHGRVAKLSTGATGQREVLMFGANDYLGLSADPRLAERVIAAISRYGVGATGTPVFYGRHQLVRELEERLAALLGGEDAMVFTNGAYGAILGVLSALTTKHDAVFHDEQMHACFYDGLKLTEARALRYPHNDLSTLEELFSDPVAIDARDRLIAMEGLFSMEGDQGRIRECLPLVRKHRAMLLVDDAHGFLTMGATGAGTAEHQGVRGEPDLTVGTFAKSTAVQGGFVVARDKAVINYLRVFARTYSFAVTPPALVASAVLAAMDLLVEEPQRREALWANMEYAKKQLAGTGFPYAGAAPLIRFRAPAGIDPLQALKALLERGIYVNPVLYPAVPLLDQGFRATLTALHTRADIDALVAAVREVLAPKSPR